MKFMLLIHEDEQQWAALTEAERQKVYGEYRELIGELSSKGQFLAGNELKPTTTSANVRVRDGKAVVTDGPYAETREQVGGFFLVETRDSAEAKEIAARIPSVRTGVIEVRAVNETEASASA